MDSTTYTFPDEDHTLGNLLRHQLLKDPQVVFAAYQVPHPLTRSVQVRVSTVDVPVDEVMSSVVDNLTDELDEFDRAFNEALA